eukprot:TRINITY_DN29544_c0_g1_i1.p1 TRINITY_DN29544_c0_g1~~TRINITY_DN29544_c0_g1_i1.p1  ORF type:complete len:143 (-),score=19.99 TRINITY_DN29544_c0_g1_i1:300-728(-)
MCIRDSPNPNPTDPTDHETKGSSGWFQERRGNPEPNPHPNPDTGQWFQEIHGSDQGPGEFEVWKCVGPPAGVAYRLSPDFKNKNSAVVGPHPPQVLRVIATEVDPLGVKWLKVVGENGWVPVTNPKKTVVCFQRVDPEEACD